jgi:polar amino acid transport system ATP-binding protein/sulfate transport system ATP-binding protein
MGILDNIAKQPQPQEGQTPAPVTPESDKHGGPRALLKIKNLNLTMGGNPILKNVNAEIIDRITPGTTRGQIVGILGPSGVGKTKLFECISGLRTPEDTGSREGFAHTGSVTLLDRDDDDAPLVPVKPGKVGVVMQQYPLFDWRTVRGNLMVALEGKKMDKKQKLDRIAAMLDKFQLGDKGDHYPSQLSGGQRQRIAIAQQLLSAGHFLLMDEPFSGLDILMIKEVLSVIQQVADMHEYNTIIVVSHDIESTASIADTLWVMGRDRDERGKVVPGAYVKKTFDLVEMGLAYRPDIKSMPGFRDLRLDIERIFPTL